MKGIMKWFQHSSIITKLAVGYAVVAVVGEATGRYRIIPFYGAGQSFIDVAYPRSSTLGAQAISGHYSSYGKNFGANIQDYAKGVGGFRLSAMPDGTGTLSAAMANTPGVWDQKLRYADQIRTGFIQRIINALRY